MIGSEEYSKYIEGNEGFRKFPYRDSVGKLTVGFGRNLVDRGIVVEEARLLLENDIKEAIEDLKKIFSEFDSLSVNRKKVLVDMRFQLGGWGFRGFKNMIAAVERKDFPTAAREIKDSKYYVQVTRRASRNVVMMLEG